MFGPLVELCFWVSQAEVDNVQHNFQNLPTPGLLVPLPSAFHGIITWCNQLTSIWYTNHIQTQLTIQNITRIRIRQCSHNLWVVVPSSLLHLCFLQLFWNQPFHAIYLITVIIHFDLFKHIMSSTHFLTACIYEVLRHRGSAFSHAMTHATFSSCE